MDGCIYFIFQWIDCIFFIFLDVFKLIAGCIPFPVHMKNMINGPSVDELEMAACLAEKVGIFVY